MICTSWRWRLPASGEKTLNPYARATSLLQRLSKPRIVGATIAQGRAGAAKHMARIVPYNPFAFPPSLEVRCARAALAANLPERKTGRRIRGQARSYEKFFLSKPRIVGAALAANIPERSTRRVREQARSTRNPPKPQWFSACNRGLGCTNLACGSRSDSSRERGACRLAGAEESPGSAG